MTAPAPSRWLVLRVRVIDRLAALVLAPVIGPIAAVLAWKVVREDGRPALVGLPRVGEDGRTFKMWKLRTMRVGEASGAAGGAVITAGDDDRVTPFGRTLRRWRLDELPQLINVIRGDMGLLGPRPETPSLVALDDERWQAVLAVRPGVAGPTQLLVERWESELLESGRAEDRYRDDVLPVKLAADRWYVEHATPAVDLRVAWSMVQRFGLRRGRTVVEAVLRAAVPEAVVVPATEA